MKKAADKILAVMAVLAICAGITACSKEEEKPIGTAAPNAGNVSQTASANEENDPVPTEAETDKPETNIITEQQGGTSEETQPEETQPIETQPEETQPIDTQPAETVPEETQPVQSEAPVFTPTGSTGDDIAALAQAQVGKMFFYGGSTPEQGFDNSGLVYYVLNQNGVSCPRSTDGIVEMGGQIAFDQLQKGDVVVFKMDDADGFKFVGIYIGDNKAVLSTTDDQPVKIADLSSNWYQSSFQYGIAVSR